MRKTIGTVAALLTACAVLSCRGGASFDTVEFARTVESPGSEYSVECSFTYLEGESPAARRIRSAMIEEAFGLENFSGTPAEAAEAYLARLEEEYASDDTLYRWHGMFQIFTSAEVVNDRTVVYTVDNNSYTGGAHGYASTVSSCYDLRTGEPLTLGDILPENNRAALAALLRRSIAAQYGFDDPRQLTEAGFFEPENIEPTENFALTDSSVIFRYNPYEIACYATGLVEVEITRAAAGELLDLSAAGF